MSRLLLLAGLAGLSPAAVVAQCLAARPDASFDFAAAPNPLFATDFTGDPLGEFPAGLIFRQGAMEVVQWEGKRALKASASSVLAHVSF